MLETWRLQELTGSAKVPVYALPESLSNASFNFPKERKVPIFSYSDLPIDGVLGVPALWESKRVILNGKEEVAYFEKPSTPGEVLVEAYQRSSEVVE